MIQIILNLKIKLVLRKDKNKKIKIVLKIQNLVIKLRKRSLYLNRAFLISIQSNSTLISITRTFLKNFANNK